MTITVIVDITGIATGIVAVVVPAVVTVSETGDCYCYYCRYCLW